MNSTLTLAAAAALSVFALGAPPALASAPPAPASADLPGITTAGTIFEREDVRTPEAQAGPQAIEAQVSVSPQTVTQVEFMNPGVVLTVTGLEAGDVVVDSLTEMRTTVRGDAVEYNIVNGTGDPAAVEVGVIDFTVTVSREGEEDRVLPASFEVVEGDEPIEGPEISSATEITAAELDAEGLQVSGTGFTPGTEIYVYLLAADYDPRTDAPVGRSIPNPLVADENGAFDVTVEVYDQGTEPGDYSVLAWDELAHIERRIDITVTDGAETPAPVDASLRVEQESYTHEETIDGVSYTGEGFFPEAPFALSIRSAGEEEWADVENVDGEEQLADAEGGVTGTLVYSENGADAAIPVGDYEIRVSQEQDGEIVEAVAAFAVVEEGGEEPAPTDEEPTPTGDEPEPTDGSEPGETGDGPAGDETGEPGAGDEKDGELAQTGADPALPVLLGGGLVLMAAGAGLYLVRRRAELS